MGLAALIPGSGADESGPALRVRQAAAHARAAVGEEEVREFVNAEAQLRALAVHPDYHTDEDRLFQLLSIASTAVVDLERSPPEESRALDEAQRLLSKILGFCTAWLRLAGTGRLVEGLDGLRGCIASELVFQTVAAVVTSESGLGASMLLAFQELEGLSLMGKAACNVEEAALVLALRKLRVVAARCGAGRQGSSAESMMRSIESFRGNLLERVQLFAGRRERRLGVPQFKEIVGDIAGLLGEAYPSNQVFEMMCLLSMQLSVALITYCPDVPDADSLEAVEWLASVLRTLLDKGGAGPHLGLLSSPGALREWLEDSGFWKRLVTQASCRAQQHAHQLMTVLLSGGVLSSSDLVVALAKEGVLSRALPPSCRAALHGALLTTASNSEMEVALDMFSEVCSLLGFADISSEGIHLLTRLNLRALDAGYLLNSASASIDGSLAVPFLLQYLQWGYRQDSADLLGQLDFASRCLTRVLLPHPNLAILLPAVAAQALSSASETGGLSRQAAARCNRALCAVALDAAALAPSMDYSQLQMASPAVLLQAMPRVGSAPPFDFENTEYWLTSLVDCLSAFLSAGADIGSREVGLLWSRLVVRPILGLPASFTAGQYFKLAFLAQPAAAATLLAPFLAAPNPRASEDAEALLERAEMRPKPGEVSPLGARSLRRGKAVVKSYGKDEKELCLQELRALLKLKTQQHVIQLLDVFKSEGLIYLEFPFCAGGSMHQWCQKVGPPLLRGDPDAFVRCLAIWRQIWQALSYIHLELVCHGDLTLDNMLLTADHHPVLTDFRCSTVAGHGPRRSLTPDYAAPELEADAAAVPSEASDVYSTGAAMAKAFLGLDLDVASCPYHPTRGQRSLPDERTDVDLADLLQHVLAENPIARPSAASVCSHRALDPSGFLRRRGLLTGQKRSPSQAFLDAAEALREEYRGRRMEDPLMFSREAVFDAIASSKVGEWREDALLGEWRVMLNEESGVDGGGLRREVVSLFFEQLESSSLVMRTGMEGSGVTTLFLNERQRADRSPQQWRQSWTAVGAMLLRALVHFGNAPLAFSSAVFDCALGRICRMPPDDAPAGEEEDVQGSIERLLKLREEKGDDWARSELLDLLRRLRREKEAGYRWMLAQRTQEERNGLSVNGLESRETIAAMLEPQSSLFLQRLGPELQGAALEWVLLWDLYLKFLGGGDRWLAYDALAEGFSAHGRRLEMWQALTGVQVVETLEGVELTAAVVLPNLEFKPGYGYETQIQYFRNVIETFSAEELSMFLRFSTGIGRLPASQRFPAGQKLSIRFMPDHLEHLPSAHTCFWVVDVPPYEDQEDLAQKLRLAIAAPQPFALS
ncbi:unnamed protein product [Effrenium voratum]|uniref:non-specific serine/threonine protein kinase n=1 Tax=Effrenium voratum TaxID=2562239 RepID=A0AA36MHF2_9DINO|nr:unnamed protein product [Effrenium voratum]